MSPITEEQLRRIMPAGRGVELWTEALNDAMTRFSIDNPQRAAAFLAQVAHESSELSRLVESLGHHKRGKGRLKREKGILGDSKRRIGIACIRREPHWAEPMVDRSRGIPIHAVSPPWGQETLVAMGRDGSQGMPAAKVALAYVKRVEGKNTGDRSGSEATGYGLFQ